MTKQNIYDDPDFFANYSRMQRSMYRLDAAGEWSAFRALLPDLHDKRVLDLGCDFGRHCRYACEQHARSVVGVDLSEKMPARAREATKDPAIKCHHVAIEDVDFSPEDFDVEISSLALHYVERFDNTLLDSGFAVTRIVEPGPSAEMLAACPDFKDEFRRPTFLLIAAAKPSGPSVTNWSPGDRERHVR